MFQVSAGQEPILGAVVEAKITHPSGSTSYLKLDDNGAGDNLKR